MLTGRDALDVGYTIGQPRVTRRQITFNDLVPLAIQILQSFPIACNAIRQTYSDVFLDEFQDCTNEQYALIKLVFQGTGIRLTAVGDTKQKIMGWAGALEGIFVAFAEDFDAVPLNLYRNFRSQAKLLRMQNEIIRVLDPQAVMQDKLIVGNEGVIEIQNFGSSCEEAESLADQIENWVNTEGVPYSEIAVLVSKQPNLYALLLMAELERRRIPFRDEQQLQDLSAEPATLLIVDYLLALFGDRQPDAYARLMAQLTDFAFDEQEQSKQRRDWLRFLKLEKTRFASSANCNGTFDSVWGYATAFLNELGNERMVSLSADYESGTRLNEVLADIRRRLEELLTIEPDLVQALALFRGDSAVRIMTIHKSKGLEFDSVVILGVEKQAFWGKTEDERCAFFVGVSRAKKRLVLTHANERPRPEGFSGKWDEVRQHHQEFIGYAEPFSGP